MSNVVSPAPMLHIGLSAWIIQDGNYADFTIGQRAKFALEFAALDGLRRVSGGPLEARRVGEARYWVRARVAFVSDGAWVIDAGSFLAYQPRWSPEEVPELGAVLEGEVYVGVDPFFYFEGLHRTPGMPPLSYPWLIRGILLETTPWIESVDEEGAPMLTRDASKEVFVAAQATNAWEDDDGHGHYALLCEREGEPTAP